MNLSKTEKKEISRQKQYRGNSGAATSWAEKRDTEENRKTGLTEPQATSSLFTRNLHSCGTHQGHHGALLSHYEVLPSGNRTGRGHSEWQLPNGKLTPLVNTASLMRLKIFPKK